MNRRDYLFIKRYESKELPSKEIETLGECKYENKYSLPEPYVDTMTMRLSSIRTNGNFETDEEVELAGPFKKIFFNPYTCKVGIIACGGLCPGLNNVIRGLVMNLYNRYEVKDIFGLKFGFEGLLSESSELIKLSPEFVSDIHLKGGCILGCSKEKPETEKMIQFLVDNNFNILFILGGDGTMVEANHLNKELRKRNVPVSVICIPKTIDNDICFTDTTFGFQTAVELSQNAINSIHYESKSYKNGIGLVRLMGKDSGFVALYSSISNGDVNMVLIPEVDISIESICEFIEMRLKKKGHIVIVMAQGALKNYSLETFIEKIHSYLNEKGFEKHTIKFVDPSYMIQSSPANASDAYFCLRLANAAVHVAMTGKTGVVICHHNDNFVSIPIKRCIYFMKKVNPNGSLYTMLKSIEGNLK